MQGPTIAPIFSAEDQGLPEGHAFYAATICVPKSRLYASVKELRKVGALRSHPAAGVTRMSHMQELQCLHHLVPCAHSSAMSWLAH